MDSESPANFPCPSCGYELAGSLLEKCPECGRAVKEKDFAALAERMSAGEQLFPMLGRNLRVIGTIAGVYALIIGLGSSIGAAALWLLAITTAFGGSVLAGWAASALAPPQDRSAWRLAWLRSHVWLQAPWIAFGPFVLLAMLVMLIVNSVPLHPDAPAGGVPAGAMAYLLGLGLILTLWFMGSLGLGLLMWARSWRRAVRRMQLQGRRIVVASGGAACLVCAGIAIVLVVAASAG